MQHKKFVACAAAALMAVALGCSNDSPTPVSPTGRRTWRERRRSSGRDAQSHGAGAAIAVNNQQPDSLVLVAGKSSRDVRGGHRRRLRGTSSRSATAAARRRSARRSRRRRQRLVGPGRTHLQPRVRSAVYVARPRGLRRRAGPVVGERDVPRARRRLHPRQRGHGSADERPNRRRDLGSDRSSCPVRASACSTTAAS